MPDNQDKVLASYASQPDTAFAPADFLSRIRSLRVQFRTSIYASVAAALLMASIISKFASLVVITDWLILFAIVSLARVYTGVLRHQGELSIRSASEWYIFFLLGCFAAGCLWAYLGMRILPGLALPAIDMLFLHALAILFIAGLTSGALYIYKNSLPGQFAFSVPAILPYSVYLIMQSDPYLPIFGTVFLIFFLFTLLLRLSQPQAR